MQNITFNSKETYLAYRSTWKTEYKTLSAEIRTLRLAERHRQRKEFAHVPLTAAEEQCLLSAGTIAGQGSLIYRRHTRSQRATAMLEELKEAKLEAQRQYLKWKEVNSAGWASGRPARAEPQSGSSGLPSDRC